MAGTGHAHRYGSFMATPMQLELATSGLAAPYVESISNRLASRELIADGPDAVGVRLIHLVLCDSDERWAELSVSVEDHESVTVAVLPELHVEGYARSLSLGVDGVVYADTSSAITADVIVAAVQGEVLLPSQAAHSIARLAHREKPASALDDRDRDLLRMLSEGATIATIAHRLHYSERTVRRHLQNLYLRLGVRNRAEAITAAVRLGLVD